MNSYFPVILFQQLPIILLTWFPNIFMLDKTKFKNNIFKKEAWYFIEKKKTPWTMPNLYLTVAIYIELIVLENFF